MRAFTVGALLLLLASAQPHEAFAQYPGEMKPQSQSDAIANQQHNFKVWAANDTVREIQQALQDKGYYAGPLDGVLNPEMRQAIWNFQRAKGLPRTARLDPATIAALELPAAGAASPGPTGSF